MSEKTVGDGESVVVGTEGDVQHVVTPDGKKVPKILREIRIESRVGVKDNPWRAESPLEVASEALKREIPDKSIKKEIPVGKR